MRGSDYGSDGHLAGAGAAVATESDSQIPGAEDILVREANHRCSNDLQLVVSLLSLQGNRAQSQEARDALNDAKERVAVLARSRAAIQRRGLTLGETLRQLCEALHSQAEPRSISVALEIEDDDFRLSASQVTTLALVVNELATNAIKHAFEENVGGFVRVSVAKAADGILTIVVDDDGLPFPELEEQEFGFGLNLVTRLVASTGGLIIIPTDGSKVSEIRVPFSDR